MENEIELLRVLRDSDLSESVKSYLMRVVEANLSGLSQSKLEEILESSVGENEDT